MSRITNRIWLTRPPGAPDNLGVDLQGGGVCLHIHGTCHLIPRADAKLLARRITEALEWWKSYGRHIAKREKARKA